MLCKTEAALNNTSEKISKWINFRGFAKISKIRKN